MESKYISRVLSHIKNKSRRKAVDYELSDHLDEKGKEYLALGYEADGALAISETAMGDADIVGEQFDALLKSRTRKTVFGYVFSVAVLLLTAGVCTAVTLMARSGGMYSSSFAFYSSMHQFSLIAAALQACAFVLNLLSMLIGIVKKRIGNLTLGFAGALGMVIFGAVQYDYSLSYYLDRLNGFDIVRMFYHVDLPQRDFGAETTVNYCLAFFLLVVFGLSLWVNIRTRVLKNKRGDLVLKRALALILAVIAALSAAGCAATVTAVYNRKDKIISSVQSDLTSLEKGFIDRLDEYAALNIWELNDGTFDLFNGCSVYDAVEPVAMSAYREPHYITAYGSSDYVSVTLDTQEMNSYWYMVTTISADVLNPFSAPDGEWYYNLYSKADLSRIPYGADISEAPLPAKLCYYAPDDSINAEQREARLFIKLIYDGYEEVYLVYSYDEESGRFLLTENTEIPFNEEATLTAEQRLALTNAVNVQFVHMLFGDVRPAYEMYSYFPLGIYYNEDYDRYRIDLAVGLTLTEPQYSSKDPANYIVSINAQFKDGHCEISSLNSSPIYEPEDFAELYSDIDVPSADEEAKALLDERSQERYNADEIRERLRVQYSQYTAYHQAMETFRDIPIPQSTEDVITLAQEYDYENWHTLEDLEMLRNKPCFGYSINDSYDFETGTSYGIGKSKWLKYNVQSQHGFLLTPDDWRYIRDIPIGLTEDEFYICCGVFTPYEYCETEEGCKIITLCFHDDEMRSKFYYTFENGFLTEIEPSEEFAAKHNR